MALLLPLPTRLARALAGCSISIIHFKFPWLSIDPVTVTVTVVSAYLLGLELVCVPSSDLLAHSGALTAYMHSRSLQ